MTIITETDAPLATSVTDELKKLVRDAFASLQLQAQKVANADSVDEDDRARLLTEAAEILKGTRRGFVPGATPALALGAGTPTPAGDPAESAIMAALSAMANDLGVSDPQALVANLAAMLAPVINEPNPTVRNARLVGMARAAEGSIPFTATGDVDHSAAIALIQAELDNERDPLNVGSLAHQLQVASSSLDVRTAERDSALADVANLVTQVTAAIGQRDSLQDIADDADIDMEALRAAINRDRVLKARLKRAAGSFRDAFRTALGL